MSGPSLVVGPLSLVLRSPVAQERGTRNQGPRTRDQNWSGRRGSNPRPTAWKAVTLPLSYSRLRLDPGAVARTSTHSLAGTPSIPAPVARLARWRRSPAVDPHRSDSGTGRDARRAELNGGEGRTRTFEATRATDLQSAAFDRSATSPVVYLES